MMMNVVAFSLQYHYVFPRKFSEQYVL